MEAIGRQSTPAVLDEFLRLVQIDSVSFEEREVAGYLKARLEEIGFSVANDDTGPSTGNLIARLQGSHAGIPLAFNAHMDTVEPGRGIRPVVRDGVVWGSGGTVLGADCKASIAAILHGLEFVKQMNMPHGDLEVILTFGEERGHAGAKAIDVSSLGARACFTLDAEAPVGVIITGAPAYQSIRATFNGRAAHAGVAPETGVDSIVAASRAIARMPLGRIDGETTANIGLIRGGTARNSVPARVELEGEARSLDNAKLEAQVGTMLQIMREEADRVGATLDLQSRREYDTFNIDPDSQPVLMARRALEGLGLAVTLETTGGGSDANDLNRKGLATVVLGTGMAGAHSVGEHIAVADLALLRDVVIELVAGAIPR